MGWLARVEGVLVLAVTQWGLAGVDCEASAVGCLQWGGLFACSCMCGVLHVACV